jgi:hypothetical protein
VSESFIRKIRSYGFGEQDMAPFKALEYGPVLVHAVDKIDLTVLALGANPHC